ncbi:MAG: hypothetical protein ACYCVY_05805 [Acidiferrobacteraceae bacterium]|jgi:hypothetical protein
MSQINSATALREAIEMRPSGPLYERAPTRDQEGQRLTDFMMLIPGLRDRPGAQFQSVLQHIEDVLGRFQEVVFIDLNVPLNLLWVSARPRPGLIFDIAGRLRRRVPEALLVGQRLWGANGRV